MRMEEKETKKERKDIYRCRSMTFADGRTISAEDFCPEDLTDEQNAYIVEAFKSVLLKN